MALTGDIEKAFLMISIRESDRDMLRFLWLEDPLQESSKLLHFQFTRLVFGLRPLPASVISHHLEKYRSEHPRVVNKIEQSLYVDDSVSGGATVQEAFEVYKSSKWILHHGGFNLRKWNTNSKTLNDMIEQVEASSGYWH